MVCIAFIPYTYVRVYSIEFKRCSLLGAARLYAQTWNSLEHFQWDFCEQFKLLLYRHEASFKGHTDVGLSSCVNFSLLISKVRERNTCVAPSVFLAEYTQYLMCIPNTHIASENFTLPGAISQLTG